MTHYPRFYMTIELYISRDEKNVLSKLLSDPAEIEGRLKAETSITDPVITIDHHNPALYNYAFIREFNRYYFITDIRSIRNNIWEISMHVDVLMTYKDQIKNCSAVIDTSEETGVNDYLANEEYKATVKNKTDIISFPYGLLDSGEYILITAGG